MYLKTEYVPIYITIEMKRVFLRRHPIRKPKYLKWNAKQEQNLSPERK